MRIWLMSDLHTEFEPFTPPDPLPDADICVVAGDFGIGGIVHALAWLEREIAPFMPVVFVAGNHDFYDTAHVDAVGKARKASSNSPGVHFLENDGVAIDGVMFLGCTLWTDFSLNGTRELSMFEASEAMNDYRRILQSKRPFQRFNPLVALRAHQTSRAYLERALGIEGPVVVVTHHAPSKMSVPDQYRGHRLSPAYASDLERMIRRHQPALWVHGHIHEAVDYTIASTRVISAPLGYPSERIDPAAAPIIVEI
jgi:Icc-related predicted phosphoesterase